jgi:hypothetical protein
MKHSIILGSTSSKTSFDERRFPHYLNYVFVFSVPLRNRSPRLLDKILMILLTVEILSSFSIVRVYLLEGSASSSGPGFGITSEWPQRDPRCLSPKGHFVEGRCDL